jgi:hypothetical protein
VNIKKCSKIVCTTNRWGMKPADIVTNMNCPLERNFIYENIGCSLLELSSCISWYSVLGMDVISLFLSVI